MAPRRAPTLRSADAPTDNTAILQAMQRMMELQQEHNELMRTSLERNQGSPMGSTNGPGTMVLPPRPGTVSDFRRLHPETFAGTETPLQAEQWLTHTEQLLQAARIADADRVDVVTIQLTDLAHIWWKAETERLEKPISWDTFATSFLEKFFPGTAKIEMESEFISLIQDERSVDEYAAEFTRLGRFAPKLVADEADRARRFLRGLNFSLQDHLAALPLSTYADVLTAARKQEQVQKRKKAAQRASAPTPKPSGGPIRRPAPAPTARAQPYPPAGDKKDIPCSYCHRPGHLRKDCRRANGLCLACGSKDHTIKDCPQRRPAPTTGGPAPAPQPGVQTRNQTKQQQQMVAKGTGKANPKRGQAFNLTAEEAETAEDVVAGNALSLLVSDLSSSYPILLDAFLFASFTLRCDTSTLNSHPCSV